ncbi:hypothetical protein [Streptomyces sp. AC495_CC817]|uniref:hypothetical protein n=1 Tax=Streptomyces sp. AC495_CC817 TaxID=2823900 RepID=UPI001C251E11|nr:hypothetical protein [Streptomyces sp. AC495_CC817]
MTNPDSFMNATDPLVPEHEDFTEGTLPTDAEQPETQGEEPIDAELGDDGQGDLDDVANTATRADDGPDDLRESTS